MTKQLPSHLLLLVFLLPLPGCLVAALAVGAAAATVGTISYTRNGAQEDFREDLDEVWAACITAAQAEGYEVEDDLAHGPSEGKIRSGELTIRVERHPGDFTRVLVRVGTFETSEHERKATLILERVEAELD
ncbi:MAG: DUF3568 family protein [Planctomycetota bacterium]|jgi:hypothetical protein